MIRVQCGPLMGLASFLLVGGPLTAQEGAVVRGRVEDASTREPISQARVLTADSSFAVFTDSIGRFAIWINPGAPVSVRVEQFGYRSQRFDLSDEAASALSVLLLEPAPIELEGIDVVEESALTTLLDDLRSRRNSYQGLVRVFDRTRLERFGSLSAWEFVRVNAPFVMDCGIGLSGLCIRGRRRTMRDPYPVDPVRICIDDRESWGAVGELATLDMWSVALVEIYSMGRGGIRIYTASYLTRNARRRRFVAKPLRFGC